MTLLAPPEPDTAAWQEWRNSGLGASEIPALLGIDPWITERGLALQKRGLIPSRQQTSVMSWGHRVEGIAREIYTEKTGRLLEPPQTYTNPRWPHLFATPDGSVPAERRLFEAKWTTKWDVPPRYVVTQNQAQMGIADADVVDVIKMGPFGEPTFHEVKRDEDDLVALLDWAEEWFDRFVLGDELPPIDGSDETRRHLASLTAPGEMTATAEQAALVEQLHLARLEKDAAELGEAKLRNLILASMAGHDVLEGDGFRVSIVKVKARTSTDWKLVAKAYRDLLGNNLPRDIAEVMRDVEAIESLYTVTGDPSTQFRPTWS